MNRKLHHQYLCALASLVSILALAMPLAAEQRGADAQTAEAAFPGTPYADLPAALQDQFRSIAETELCPCGESVDSLSECLQAAESCGVARAGAFAIMQALYRGNSETQARQAFSEQVEAFQRVHQFSPPAAQSRGSDTAKVTVVEFADFECPYCKRVSEILGELQSASPESVRVQFMHFPLSNHRNAEESAMASVAAGKQGKFWEFHDRLFARQAELQGSIDPLRIFREIASELSLDLEQFEADFRDPATYRSVRAQKSVGAETGLTGTPTLFINGRIYVGEMTIESIGQAVQTAQSEEE